MKITCSDATIKNMSRVIQKTIANKLSDRHFVFQISESTGISGKAHILGFVHFINENEILNQFLC